MIRPTPYPTAVNRSIGEIPFAGFMDWNTELVGKAPIALHDSVTAAFNTGLGAGYSALWMIPIG